MNKKALNDAVDSLKTDTTSIADPHLKSAFTGLLNLVEILASENEELKVENQQLKNEVNILKGELGKPDIKPKNSKNTDTDKDTDTDTDTDESTEDAAKDTDISSEKERQEGANDDHGENNGEPENPKKKKTCSTIQIGCGPCRP